MNNYELKDDCNCLKQLSAQHKNRNSVKILTNFICFESKKVSFFNAYYLLWGIPGNKLNTTLREVGEILNFEHLKTLMPIKEVILEKDESIQEAEENSQE